ncbi:hypothetical protein BDP27DRAFT_1362594 [Rhodocollybia butyracea]|uniref:Uncharacterized protein n=1 Tax=Rhodocollybia butyracea TaxID=206335 RepID=A0A9P5PQW1_9AGAR|nr:hypothetical protein BDP27DRAFT_1362594 [Rhodocollybia butyracea]
MQFTLAFVTAALVTLTVAVPQVPPAPTPPSGTPSFVYTCTDGAAPMCCTSSFVKVARLTTLSKAVYPPVKSSAVGTLPLVSTLHVLLPPLTRRERQRFSFDTTVEIWYLATVYPSFEFVIDSEGL